MGAEVLNFVLKTTVSQWSRWGTSLEARRQVIRFLREARPRSEVRHCCTDGRGRLGIGMRMKRSIQVEVPFMEMEKEQEKVRGGDGLCLGHVQDLWVWSSAGRLGLEKEACVSLGCNGQQGLRVWMACHWRTSWDRDPHTIHGPIQSLSTSETGWISFEDRNISSVAAFSTQSAAQS